MKLNPEKYNRKVTLSWTVYGGSKMEHIEEFEEVKCVGCGKEYTNDELTQENGIRIVAHVHEVNGKLSKDIQEQFNKLQKTAFKGSKI